MSRTYSTEKRCLSPFTDLVARRECWGDVVVRVPEEKWEAPSNDEQRKTGVDAAKECIPERIEIL